MSKIKLPFRVHPIVLAAACLVAIVAIIGLLYAMATNQLIDFIMLFRDAVVLVYLFVIRIGLPILLLLGLGLWVERKLNPDAARESRPLAERLPILKRIHWPHLSARATLAITLIGVLWLAAIGIAVSRFLFGIGYVTNLSDQFPWGLWISFDVVSGVALAAGGFVMAGTVHVFNIEKYHPIVRPAILTALLGYLLVVFGILFDLGRWYNVWHPIFMWNIHSPMLEVAWCVMLYTTVLALEFSPIIFEKFKLQWPLKIMRRITIPLVILGMVLSTLHQSSLGTLFLIFPEKISPLWYTPLLPVFFFLSAVAVGLGMTIVESNLSARALGMELESDLLKGLGRAASIVLAIYLALKVFDLVSRGAYTYLTASGFHTALYFTEIFFGVITPMVILATRHGRENARLVYPRGRFDRRRCRVESSEHLHVGVVDVRKWRADLCPIFERDNHLSRVGGGRSGCVWDGRQVLAGLYGQARAFTRIERTYASAPFPHRERGGAGHSVLVLFGESDRYLLADCLERTLSTLGLGSEKKERLSFVRAIARLFPTLGLSAKAGLWVVILTVVVIGLFAYLGTAALSENTQRNLQERVVLAQMTATYIDAVLDNIHGVLTDTAGERDWSNPQSANVALDQAYRRLSPFASHIFLVNSAGACHRRAALDAGKLIDLWEYSFRQRSAKWDRFRRLTGRPADWLLGAVGSRRRAGPQCSRRRLRCAGNYPGFEQSQYPRVFQSDRTGADGLHGSSGFGRANPREHASRARGESE